MLDLKMTVEMFVIGTGLNDAAHSVVRLPQIEVIQVVPIGIASIFIAHVLIFKPGPHVVVQRALVDKCEASEVRLRRWRQGCRVGKPSGELLGTFVERSVCVEGIGELRIEVRDIGFRLQFRLKWWRDQLLR